MAYVLSTTTTGHFESYDLDALPHLTWTNPATQEQQVMPARQLLQEGKIGVHQLFNLLRDRGIPGVEPTMGAQSLLVCWARELKKQQEAATVLVGDAGANSDKRNQHQQEPPLSETTNILKW